MNDDKNSNYGTPGRQRREVNLFKLFRIFWQGKLTVLAFTVLFSVAGVIYALVLPDIYSSDVKLAPAEQAQGNLGGMAEQLGGLASLAGVQLPQGQVDKATVAYEILISRKFLTEFIERHDLHADILAAEAWDSESNEIIYDDEIYDAQNNRWLEYADGQQPSTWVAVDELREQIFISKDKATGFVTITVLHLSPTIAKQWGEWLIEDINDYMRKRDVAEAKLSIEFLKEELSSTTLANMQQIFYQLLEQQTQIIMMANVRQEYVFQVLDPPMVAEEKSAPARALICIGFFVLGAFLGMLVVYVRHALREEKAAIQD